MQAFILHPPSGMFSYGASGITEAIKAYEAHQYTVGAQINMPDCTLDGEDAAEECFDVTNNPSRQAERERVYGRHRSVSVGDIVLLIGNGGAWLCTSCGWQKLNG